MIIFFPIGLRTSQLITFKGKKTVTLIRATFLEFQAVKTSFPPTLLFRLLSASRPRRATPPPPPLFFLSSLVSFSRITRFPFSADPKRRRKLSATLVTFSIFFVRYGSEKKKIKRVSGCEAKERREREREREVRFLVDEGGRRGWGGRKGE